VVSEEKRAVGMANSGILQTDVDHHFIRQTLYDLYGLSKNFERAHA
jgi:hypothetical protein